MINVFLKKACFFTVLLSVIVAGSADVFAGDIDTQNANRLLLAEGLDALRLKIGASKILQDGMWRATYNPGQRDVLYMPVVDNTVLTYKDYDAQLFFSRAVDLDQNVGEMIRFDDLTDLFKVFFQKNVDGISATQASEKAENIAFLFKLMTFNEHRLGVSLHKEWRYGSWLFEGKTWVGLAERNYWLEVDERNRLGQAVSEMLALPDTPIDYNDFVMIRAGIGDTRLRAGFVAKPLKNSEVVIGVQGILPTARTLFTPMRNKAIPVTDFDKLKNFMIDRAKEVMLYPELGNGSFYGFGLFTRGHIDIPAEHIRLSTQIGLDYFYSSSQTRFFMQKQVFDQSGFPLPEVLLEDEETEEEYAAPDNDLRLFMHRFLVPEPREVTIKPRFIYHANCAVQWRPNNWNLFAGYDFYFRDKEVLGDFSYGVSAERYDLTQQVRSGEKEQHKVFAGLVYSAHLENVWLFYHTFEKLRASFKLSGESSFASYGIGDDFAVSLGMGITF